MAASLGTSQLKVRLRGEDVMCPADAVIFAVIP
jgi:hypothetical protein